MISYRSLLLITIVVNDRKVKTRLGHPGHILSGSSRSDLVYEIFGPYVDSAVHYMH